MNSKVFLVLRILLGLFVLIFGLNKFLHFMPGPQNLSPDAQAYFAALMSGKTMMLIATVEIVSGLALIFNKFGALMAIILMSISVNVILFHVILDIGNILPGIALFVLNILVLYGYKEKYKSLLN